MKILFFMLLAMTAAAGRRPSATVPQDTIERLKKIYPNQTEAFILERIHNAKSTFDKWRGFPPYYYELLTRAGSILPTDFNDRQGVCAGDAHLENFGFVYLDRPYFTLNDLDDSCTCSLNSDALRLFIGHRLISPISAREWLEEYKAGLSGNDRPMPEYVKKLEAESLKKKDQLPKKYKKIWEAKKCGGDFNPLGGEEFKRYSQLMRVEGKILALGCSRTKDSGGSAGGQRLILFYEDNKVPRAVELKPLETPAPMVFKEVSSGTRQDQFSQGAFTFFGPKSAGKYYPISLEKGLYQHRPLWGGNVGVALDDLNSADLKEVMLYEARTLGKYHRVSSAKQPEISAESWEKVALDIEKKWRTEFAE